jgi:hypothetical protein
MERQYALPLVDSTNAYLISYARSKMRLWRNRRQFSGGEGNSLKTGDHPVTDGRLRLTPMEED